MEKELSNFLSNDAIKNIVANNNRSFEKLVTLYLLEKYNIPSEHLNEYITQKSKDGGYDALIKLTENDIVLMEAKLRSNIENDLKMADFSKSIIIAINLSAKKIYIGSNNHLSANTIKELFTFEYKTGLKWFFLDSVTLFEWIESKKDELLPNYKEIIDLISYSKIYYEEKKYPRIEEIRDLHSNFQKDHCEQLFFSQTFINSKRKRDSVQMYARLSSDYSCIISVEGSAGFGKSFFINKTLSKIQSKNSINQIIHIDLGNYSISQMVFLKIIEELWVTNRNLIYDIKNDDIKDIIQSICSEWSDEAKINAVANSLQSELHTEISELVLVEFLTETYNNICNQRKIIFYFENFNKSNPVVINFVINFTKRICKKAKIIFEIRSSVFIDANMTESEWNNCVDKLLKITDYKYKIESIDAEAIENYIDILTPHKKLPSKTKKIIIKHLGLSPLLISNFVNYLKITGIIDNLTEDIFYLETEKIFNEYEADNILYLCFDAFIQKSDMYAKIFLFARIFDGRIPVDFIKNHIVTDENEYNYIILCLQNANLFFEFENELVISHLLLQKCLNEQKNNMFIEDDIRSLLKVTANEINKYIDDSDRIEQIKINILESLNSYLKLAELSIDYSVKMYKTGAYKQCYIYAEKAYNAIQKYENYKATNIYTTIHKIYALLALIQSSGFIKSDTFDLLKHRVEEIQICFNDNEVGIKKLNNYFNILGHYSMVLSRYFIHYGKYEKALQIMEYAYNNISLVEKAPIKMRLHIVWEYAISTKHCIGIDKEISILKKWKKQYKDSDGLNIIYNNSVYAKNIFVNPKISYEYAVKNLKQKENNDEIATHIHIDVHIWHAEMVLEKYEKVYSEINENLEKIEEYGLRNELGRCYHILAFYYSVKNKPNKAISLYNKALNIYDNDSYVEYILPILLDYSIFLLRRNNCKEAKIHIEEAINIINTYYKSQLENIIPKDIRYSHIHMSAIILLNEIKRYKIEKDFIDKLKNNIDCDLLNKYYFSEWDSPVFRELIENTAYYHSGLLFTGC